MVTLSFISRIIAAVLSGCFYAEMVVVTIKPAEPDLVNTGGGKRSQTYFVPSDHFVVVLRRGQVDE